MDDDERAELKRKLIAGELDDPNDPFSRPPDIWYQNGVDRRACYWCIDGVWHWYIVLDDGQVIAEGVGPP